MHKRRTQVFIALGISTALVGIGLYLVVRPAPTKAPTDTTNNVLQVTQYIENKPYYDIKASYPAHTPLRESTGERADNIATELMKRFVDDTVAQFKSDGNFENLTAEDVKMLGFEDGRKEMLQINYATASSKESLSYLFTIYQDTLGAHGNTFYHTFTFKTADGSTLGLKDLFVPNAPYLDTLSSISRAKLPAIIAENTDSKLSDISQDDIVQGTGPNEVNFASFFLDGTSLVILFPPYAVAAYAAGPQTLAIPLTDLKNILRPEFQ